MPGSNSGNDLMRNAYLETIGMVRDYSDIYIPETEK